MNRGNERRVIFRDDCDYKRFLANIADGCARYDVETHAYVCMPNHFHLYLRTREANLNRFMHRVLTAYTIWHNLKHERVGHLFQGRYKAILVEDEEYGLEVSRYTHLNPVRTELMKGRTPKTRREFLRTYKWSSYRAMIGLEDVPSFLHCQETLCWFGRTVREQKRKYARFVEDAILHRVENPFGNIRAQVILGSDGFLNAIRNKLAASIATDMASEKNRDEVLAVSLERLIDVVAEEYGVEPSELRKMTRGRTRNEARQVVFFLALRYCHGGTTLKEIARVMGASTPSSVRMSHDRLSERLRSDRQLERRVRKLIKLLIVKP